LKNYGGGATRPLLRDECMEELHGNRTVRPHPKVWTRVQKWESSVNDGVPERFRYGSVQKKMRVQKKMS